MTIQMFSDETISSTNSFYIYSSIFGQICNLNRLEYDIDNIINTNRTLLGSNFKELKANRLNSTNLKTVGKVYKLVFEKLKSYLATKNTGYIIALYSKKKHEDNVDYLISVVKKLLIAGSFKPYFPQITSNDYPAIYYRINHLMLYFKYRHLIAKNNVNFELFPDSSGKILNYKDKLIKINSPQLKMTMQTTFFDGIRILGNSICNLLIKINLQGWSNQTNYIKRYEPLDSKNCRLIQLCDAISNFTFNSLKELTLLNDEATYFKFNLLAENLFCRDELIELSNRFFLDSKNELCCQIDLMGNISIYL